MSGVSQRQRGKKGDTTSTTHNSHGNRQRHQCKRAMMLHLK